ncbi:MAG: glycosyltransferase, partial [Acidimicrobiales bacterium]
MPAPRDVVFTFATDSWADAVTRGHFMPADQLVLALGRSPLVRRLLVTDGWRSGPIRALRRLQGRSRPPLPSRILDQHHLTPLRLRRHDPVAPAPLRRAYVRYDAQMARAAARLDLRQPAVITGNPFVAAYSPLAWAGPVTLYLWDNWAAYPPARPWWPAYEAAYREVAASGRRVVAVSDALIERVRPAGPSAIVPNGITVDQWEPPWAVP